ncbi:peptidoglycan editing factor PgeF [Aquibacillus rhizosphaerae]|uniref:Purine nucleoside phosphorylase n=1 Tax=Aquibacillus rhizosphaerae TaxID=3051431 RepID=A0ABT7L2C3_9BACI|nr:peptidoglycan editing factor PgeF [Aquibacillus sp. LR5S19]MDL4839983.1 peptidoglycan editing factor PgeF [Aquibacillus sp. LR5S19]
MEPFQKIDNSTTLMIKEWMDEQSNLVAGMTTRHGGVSKSPFATMNLGFHVQDEYQDVLDNRHLLSSILQQPLDNWVMGEQIHGTKVKVINEIDLAKGAKYHEDALSGVDGLLTNRPGVLCTAMFADCVPLFFYDSNSSWIGIAHAGWRGTVNKIAVEMILAFVEQNVDIKTLKVAIGPCISKMAYEVDEKVIQNIPETFKSNVITSTGSGRYLLDLRQLNREIIMQAGVLEENISVTGYCTYQHDIFFSHRRDNGTTGRMLGFIGYRE